MIVWGFMKMSMSNKKKFVRNTKHHLLCLTFKRHDVGMKRWFGH